MADFDLFAGDTQTLEITVVDELGQPLDITGATVRWWASSSPYVRPPAIKKETGSGVTLVDAAHGRFNVELAAADTEALRAGPVYYEVEIDDDGRVNTVLSGAFNVKPALIVPG
jgi:hypothetical protein